MVQQMDYKVVERQAVRILGIRCTTPYGGGTWGIIKSDGTYEKIEKISGHMCDLGLCFGFDSEGNNDYMCGVEYDGEDIPGFDYYQYPDSTWLVFTAKGSISSGVLGQTWKRIYGEFMPQSEYHQQDLPTIERYIEWNETSDVCNVEIMIPVLK